MVNHDFNKFPELTNAQLGELYFDSPHKQILYNFQGVVEKVVDGDTIRVSTNFRDFDTVVRFLDIDAPEMNEGGQESREWLRSQIEGREIYVIVNRKQRVDKYGRILGRIMHAGQDINDLSMLMGHAVDFERRNDFKPIDPYRAVELAIDV